MAKGQWSRPRQSSTIDHRPSAMTLVTHPGGERRLGGGQPGHRHAVGRGADVVQPDLVEEVHRSGVAAVLAADPELEVLARLAAALDADLDQIADALHVGRRERILLEDLLLLVDLQKLPDIVA